MVPALARPPTAEPKTSVSAVEMGARQRDISVSEFFTKNRHLLGFDNPRKALLTCVKEAVDNALDAAEEAGILPEVVVILAVAPNNGEAPPPASQATRFRVTVADNGPGIVRHQIPPIFAKLLYGSKFHRLRMSRGQQGIGISAAGMYAQEICKTAKLSPNARPRNIHGTEAEVLYKAIQATKIMAPPSNCISPIGEKAILHGLYKQIKGEFYTAVTRPPSVYRGNPFVIEAGLAFGKGPGQATGAPGAPAGPPAAGGQRGGG